MHLSDSRLLRSKINKTVITDSFPKLVTKQSNSCRGLDRLLGYHEIEAPRVSRHSAHEGGKVVSPKHQLPLPHKRYPWYSFLLEAESAPVP
jgi:hypothetical protein